MGGGTSCTVGVVGTRHSLAEACKHSNMFTPCTHAHLGPVYAEAAAQAAAHTSDSRGGPSRSYRTATHARALGVAAPPHLDGGILVSFGQRSRVDVRMRHTPIAGTDVKGDRICRHAVRREGTSQQRSRLKEKRQQRLVCVFLYLLAGPAAAPLEPSSRNDHSSC